MCVYSIPLPLSIDLSVCAVVNGGREEYLPCVVPLGPEQVITEVTSWGGDWLVVWQRLITYTHSQTCSGVKLYNCIDWNSYKHFYIE